MLTFSDTNLGSTTVLCIQWSTNRLLNFEKLIAFQLFLAFSEKIKYPLRKQEKNPIEMLKFKGQDFNFSKDEVIATFSYH